VKLSEKKIAERGGGLYCISACSWTVHLSFLIFNNNNKKTNTQKTKQKKKKKKKKRV
jgi:hypothetical protein